MAGGSLGAVSGRGRGRIITEINVTPLVDIMLVLLIIFMVTTTTMVMDSMDVKLPEAASGQPTKASLVAILITAQGKLYLNGQPTDLAKIQRFIREERKQNLNVEAIVAGDKRVPHGTVVTVLDLVQGEGISKVAINVLKKPRD